MTIPKLIIELKPQPTKDVRLTVVLTEDEKDNLDFISKNLNMTYTEIFRQVIKQLNTQLRTENLEKHENAKKPNNGQ